MRAQNLAYQDRAQRYLDHHRAIFGAIGKGQPEAAFRAMQEHLEVIQRDLEQAESDGDRPG
jgi:DNA-binding FadR family transcriptional regulator